MDYTSNTTMRRLQTIFQGMINKFNESMDKWWHFNGSVMKHVLANANGFTPTPFLESPKTIMDFKEESMDFSNDNSKKNPTKIINKVDVSSHI